MGCEDAQKLTDDQIQQKLDDLDGWSLRDGKLHWEKRFANFTEAFSFMTAVAIEAQAMNHHPEWFNVYHTVKIDLTTHDVGGISDYDFQLAEKVNRHAAKF